MFSDDAQNVPGLVVAPEVGGGHDEAVVLRQQAHELAAHAALRHAHTQLVQRLLPAPVAATVMDIGIRF